MNKNRLRKRLMRDEGLSLLPYEDSRGLLTIGYGRCIEKIGITEEESLYLLENDMKRVLDALSKYSWWVSLDDVRQEAITNMAFNLGINGLLNFKKMIAALEAHNYALASIEAHNSKWYSQVGRRAQEICFALLHGKYPVSP